MRWARARRGVTTGRGTRAAERRHRRRGNGGRARRRLTCSLSLALRLARSSFSRRRRSILASSPASRRGPVERERALAAATPWSAVCCCSCATFLRRLRFSSFHSRALARRCWSEGVSGCIPVFPKGLTGLRVKLMMGGMCPGTAMCEGTAVGIV